jgi:hypothetical protein
MELLTRLLAANATGRRLTSAVDHEAPLAVPRQSHKSLSRLQTRSGRHLLALAFVEAQDRPINYSSGSAGPCRHGNRSTATVAEPLLLR